MFNTFFNHFDEKMLKENVIFFWRLKNLFYLCNRKTKGSIAQLV